MQQYKNSLKSKTDLRCWFTTKLYCMVQLIIFFKADIVSVQTKYSVMVIQLSQLLVYKQIVYKEYNSLNLNDFI